MKKSFLSLALLLSGLSMIAQEIIDLPFDQTNEIVYNQQEKEYYSEIWKKKVITNVSQPTLEVFRPSKENSNGTSIVLAPSSGGFFVHGKKEQSEEITTWLTKKGITVFLLKYRLVPTGKDGVAEVKKLVRKDKEKLYEHARKLLPLTVEDGLSAIAYVRMNSEKLGVVKNKIGFMGFSAGGALTMGVANSYQPINRPDFLVPVYPWTKVIEAENPQKDAPPMLIISSNDDPEIKFNKALAIYQKWADDNLNVELYTSSENGENSSKGATNKGWINHFYDWSVSEGLISLNE